MLYGFFSTSVFWASLFLLCHSSEYDQCVHCKSLNGIFIILVLYVEDMLVASKSMGKINKVNAQMAMTIVCTSKFEW